MTNNFNNIDSFGIGSDNVDDNPLRNSMEVFRLDNSEDIKQIDLELRGYEYDAIKKLWIAPTNKKNKFNMSNECRKFIVTSLRVILTKSNCQANLSPKYGGLEEYTWKVDSLAQAFEENLIYRQNEYHLTMNDINWISTLYQETIRTFFTRVLGDGERKRNAPDERYNHNDDMNSDDKNKWGLN